MTLWEINMAVAGVVNDRSKVRRQIGYSCLALLFFLAFSGATVSVTTFWIKNHSVTDKCDNISCLLSTSGLNTASHPEAVCWVALGGGCVVCGLSFLFTVSLVIRICCAAKLYCCLATLELLVVALLFAVACLAGIFFLLGVEGDNSSLIKALVDCDDDKVKSNDIIDFLRQAEISVWASALFLVLAVALWFCMMLKCSEPERRLENRQLITAVLPQAPEPATERSRLVNNSS